MKTVVNISLACMAVLWAVNATVCLAQEHPRQSPAAKHGAKARAYANREDDNGQAGADRAPAESGTAQEADKRLGVDDGALDKAQKDVGETFRSIEKALDLLK